MCLMTTASNDEQERTQKQQPQSDVVTGMGEEEGGAMRTAGYLPASGDHDDKVPAPNARTEVDESPQLGGDANGWQPPSATTPSATTETTKSDAAAVASPPSAAAEDEAAIGSATGTSASNWPRKGIVKPHANDVLYGRGGGTNHHPGNKRFRKMVEDRKLRYVNSKRLEKPLIAFEIIKIWRAQDPPGRFLKKDKTTGLWNDQGDAVARKKTSQALREQAPLIRELGNGELMDDFGDMGFDEEDDEVAPRPAAAAARGSGIAETPAQVDVEVEHVLMDEECQFVPNAAAPAPAPFQAPSESSGSKMEWRGYTSEQLMVTEGEVSTGRGLSFGVREHSLGEYPLDHATVTQTAIDAAFDQRSGAWATPPNYFAIAHSHSLTTQAPAEVGTEETSPSSTAVPVADVLEAIEIPAVQSIRSASLASDDTAVTTCSKDVIKRATSHQNETYETKRYLVGPSVKRAALSRGDTSNATPHFVSDDALLDTIVDDTNPYAAAAAAAAASLSVAVDAPAHAPPRVERKPFKDDLEMRELTQNMEKSSLISMDDLPAHFAEHPAPPMAARAAGGDRLTTIDHIAMDLMVHPVSLSRTNTEEIIRTLASDLDEGTVRSLLSGGGVGGGSGGLFDPFDRTKSS